MNIDAGLVRIQPCKNAEEAQINAMKEAASTGSLPMPVVMFRQGNRINLSGAMLMSWVRSRLETRSAAKGGRLSETVNAMNRPEIPEHSDAIAKYLRENHEKGYILPPMTLNVQHPVNLYTLDSSSTIGLAYLVIPGSAKLSITDGQHRRSGIVKAMEALEAAGAEGDFAADAVAVMVTCERDFSQIHQDFADCSKTKSLPPSLLAVFDRRNPANRMVIEMAEGCKLFKGRIDTTSSTLSKKSTFLFLANQVRQLVKELLVGSYAVADIEFERRANELKLDDEARFKEEFDCFKEFVDYLTARIPVWNEIASVKPGTMEASQIPIKRDEGWICLTATGLNLIGRVAHLVFSKPDLKKDWTKYADRLAALDWSKSAPLWQGNIVQPGPKGPRILTAQAPMRAAYDAILRELKLSEQAQAGK